MQFLHRGWIVSVKDGQEAKDEREKYCESLVQAVVVLQVVRSFTILHTYRLYLSLCIKRSTNWSLCHPNWMTPPPRHLFITGLRDELSPPADTSDTIVCVDQRSCLSVCVWACRVLGGAADSQPLLEHQEKGQGLGATHYPLR